MALQDTERDIVSSFVKQFYAGTPFIPREIMLPCEVEDEQVVSELAFCQKRGQKVYLRVPKKGTKEKLVELAGKNAAMVLSQDKERMKREEGRTIGAMKEIAELASASGTDAGWKPTIFPISAVLSRSVPWLFMNRGSQNAAITGNLRSRRFRDRMITPVWKKC